MSDLNGRTIGGFIVEREIGRGGMGVVLLARHSALDRSTVLKKLRRDLADTEDLVERFDREAQAAAAVHHENVVTVYDYFRHRSDHYIAQEYVAGVSLHAAIQRAGPLPPRIAALIGLGVARGLEEIHSHGTVHRDLKPHNILLGRRGEVKIADFGIALPAVGSALTRPGVALGSPPYMSPEQMSGERVDSRTDLFAFGVILYEMLTGATPYAELREDEPGSLVDSMRREQYRRISRAAPGTPRWLARVVKTCLRGKARRRSGATARIRREIERRIGKISPVDARAELASWLWEHHVHEAVDGETVVRVAVSVPEPPQAAAGWGTWLLASAICGVVLGGLLLIEARPRAVESHPIARVRTEATFAPEAEERAASTLPAGPPLAEPSDEAPPAGP